MAAYPTFLIANAEGITLDRWAGYEGVDAFLSALQKAKDDPTTVDEKIARYERRPTLEDAVKLGRILSQSGNYEEGIHYYTEAGALSSAGDYSYEIFETTAIGCRHGVFALERATEAAEAALSSVRVRPSDKGEIYYYARWLEKKKKVEGYAVQFLEPCYQAVASADSNEVDEDLKTDLAIEHAITIEKNPTRAAQLKFESMPEGWQRDPDQINRYAWWCYQHEVDTERAAELAHGGITVAPHGSKRAALLDTAAELCRRLGRRQEAIQHLEEAIKEDPENAETASKLKQWKEAGS